MKAPLGRPVAMAVVPDAAAGLRAAARGATLLQLRHPAATARALERAHLRSDPPKPRQRLPATSIPHLSPARHRLPPRPHLHAPHRHAPDL